jgi:hypothetical protein
VHWRTYITSSLNLAGGLYSPPDQSTSSAIPLAAEHCGWRRRAVYRVVGLPAHGLRRMRAVSLGCRTQVDNDTSHGGNHRLALRYPLCRGRRCFRGDVVTINHDLCQRYTVFLRHLNGVERRSTKVGLRPPGRFRPSALPVFLPRSSMSPGLRHLVAMSSQAGVE